MTPEYISFSKFFKKIEATTKLRKLQGYLEHAEERRDFAVHLNYIENYHVPSKLMYVMTNMFE